MKIIKTIKITGTIILFVLFTQSLFAQDKVIDQIVAVVGSNIILKSDVEHTHIAQQAQGYTSEGDMKCEILENFLVDKLLVAEAELDTLIEVTPSQVNQQMDAQIQMYLQHFETEKAVEAYFNKPIAQIKADAQENIRNNLLSQQMQNKIVENVTVTPSEVRFHYRNLKDDEIPVIPTQYEYAQITFTPRVELEEDNRVKAELREIKRKIENGSLSFAVAAVLNSQEPGAARTGGEIGFLGRGQLDPAYANAAFNLKGDKVSNVVKSAFGYHIIQLIEKKGEKANTRHILMKPKVSADSKVQAYERLDSLTNLIRKNEISFDEAAVMFSSDRNTKNNGGVAINPATMSSKFTVDELDSDVSKIITTMNLNEISIPFETIDPENQQMVYKVVKLINKVEGHKANLQNDYQQLADMYLAKKKEEVLQEWISSRQSDTYIRIDETYANCNYKFKNWIK